MPQISLNQIFGKNLKDFKLWSKNESIVGLDIGSSSIKAVQLRREKERAILETYGELATGPYAGLEVGQVAHLPEDKVAAMLKSLFKEAGINAKEAIVAIPLRGSFLTTIKLPKIDEKEMDAMVKFEARKFIPVMIEEIEFDWWVLPPSLKNTARQSQSSPQQLVDAGSPQKAGEMVDVLIVAIQKDLLNKYRQVVSSAGLGTVRFEIEIFSSIRSCIFRQTSPVMIIDFGASSTKFSIVDYGVLRTTPHSVDRGTQMLTSSIAKSMNISFGRAEEMKLQVGLSSRPEHKELVSVMEPTLNYIFSEGRQMMNIFKNKTGETVGKVILSGGGALLGNITDMAVKNLGVECVTADPFAKAQYAPFLQEVLKQIGPSFSCAAGLALREV